MPRRFYYISILTIWICSVKAQVPDERINELKSQLTAAKSDPARLELATNLGVGYRFSNIDSSMYYANAAWELAKKINSLEYQGMLLSLKGAILLEIGALPESMKLQYEALKICDQTHDDSTRAFALNRIGNIYMELADYKKANEYYFLSARHFQARKDSIYYNEISNIGNIYTLLQNPDSALHYLQIVLETIHKTNNRFIIVRPELMFRLGNAYKVKGKNDKAIEYYRMGVFESQIDNDVRNLTMNYLSLAKLYMDINLHDSALNYAHKSMTAGKAVSFTKGIYESSLLLSKIFQKDNRYDSALTYLLIANTEKEDLIGTKRFQELQHIIFDEEDRQRNSEAAKIKFQNQIRQYALVGGLGVFLLIALILYRNNRVKQKANSILGKQKEEINFQKNKLEKALADLKSAQSQLIQSEKMASLGVLTAGIAHEIQNPMNFVNNFSEVNRELVNELQNELASGNVERAIAISRDIGNNEEKISQHGMRANSIVTGMLQHTRASSGVRELTDINALADEWIRLSYHGMRAKDKMFSVEINKGFDESIGKIYIVPQDIGRVLMNLYNNAFYAISEKMKRPPNGYQPTVSVTTKKIPGKIEVHVKDNGNGIPQKILDKIFQPFFTTKPSGQGTGLGLSLAYDIVKAHGGQIRVESEEGKGTEFIVELPFNQS